MGKKTFKKITNYLGDVTFTFLLRNAHKMSYEKMMSRSEFLASIYYKFSKRRVKIAEDNIRQAFNGELSEEEVRNLAKKSMVNFLFEAFMFFSLPKKDPEKIRDMVEIHHIEYAEKVLAREKGCILLTAHYGNWEIMARKLCLEGLKVNVIARDSDNMGMTETTRDIREGGGYKVFSRNQPLTGVVRALRKNEFLGILPDQHDYTGIMATFFGRPARTSTGCASLSLRTGAAILPVYCRRVDFGKYVMEIYPEIEFEKSGDNEKDLENLTQKVNDAMESEIRKYPEHWLWVHNRWK